MSSELKVTSTFNIQIHNLTKELKLNSHDDE